jgi:hypothetical protein
MRKFLVSTAIALALVASANAQSQFPANTLWGNSSSSTGLPNTLGVPTCTAGQALSYTGGTGFSCVAVAGGGSGTPGGANTQVQYNSSGAFAGASAITTNGTSLTIGGPFASDAQLTINANTLALPAVSAIGQTLLHLGGADGVIPNIVIDTFSNVAVNFAVRHRRGRWPLGRLPSARR